MDVHLVVVLVANLATVATTASVRLSNFRLQLSGSPCINKSYRTRRF